MIRRFFVLIFICRCGLSFAVEPIVENSFDFQSVEVSTAISLYLKEVVKKPYMLCGDVLSDNRKVSIRASGKFLSGPLFSALLDDHGFQAVDRNGVMVVCKKNKISDEISEDVLYRVKHRDSTYLVDLVYPLIKGVFANKRLAPVGALSVGGGNNDAQPISASSPVGSAFKSSNDDYILFSGTSQEIMKLKKLLYQLDVPTGEVVIKAYMYEVGSNQSDTSALNLVVSILSSKIQAGIASVALGDYLRLKTSSIDLVASALKSDGRFKMVTAPYQRVRSGKTARFVSGAQVSVLGGIVTNQTGVTQQSFDRVESGTILEVSPVVREDSFDVDLFQQVSSFVAAQTGGSAPPTLNKRELRTSLTMKDGEVVVIAGLKESKNEDAKSGLPFLPFSLAKSRSATSSELILLLELKRL